MERLFNGSDEGRGQWKPLATSDADAFVIQDDSVEHVATKPVIRS